MLYPETNIKSIMLQYNFLNKMKSGILVFILHQSSHH